LPALEVVDLHHRYGERLAVQGMALRVEPGEIVGLVGRNGAGKTTTLRAIMGILRPLRGEIRWDGRPATAADRSHFGYMPEERGLYPRMRLFDQLQYFARLHGLSAVEAGQQATHWLEVLELDGRQRDKVDALSHGNQQRAQLAVALVHRPELLVLDKPFAGLDPTAVDTLSGVLQGQAADGVAVLFSSHQLELVERLCRRVVIVDQGRLLAEGTLSELRSQFPQRLRVRVDGARGWAAGLPGVQVEQEGPDGTLLRLEPQVSSAQILAAAQLAGTVEHFAFESGGLVDLYRQLVAAA
jgi:ABC-2 type transport system ATP-binding protein